jgi:hypothetical protein
MIPIQTTKYCCGSGNAHMIETLWPMKKRDKKFFMALFQCNTCKEYTLRGENQEKEWNTFVEVLNKEKVDALILQKKERKNEH